MTTADVRTFRREILSFSRDDGGLDLLDLLFDRIVRIAPDQVAALDAGDPRMLQYCERLHLFESPEIVALRAKALAARLAEPAPPPASPPIDDVDWEAARDWPEIVAAEWRDPERLRRLAEDRAGGRRYLMLRGFLEPDTARAIAAAAESLPFERFESDVVRGDKCLLGGDQLRDWRIFLVGRRTRRLFGALLGRELPDGLVMNAWRMHPGDGMAIHPDGRLYWATISLGLCEGWKAADGGAIAFGDPEADGFVVRERWFPHLGDVCLFVPTPTTWHIVEPSARRRITATGWWVTR
jgi:hypothetical protein